MINVLFKEEKVIFSPVDNDKKNDEFFIRLKNIAGQLMGSKLDGNILYIKSDTLNESLIKNWLTNNFRLNTFNFLDSKRINKIVRCIEEFIYGDDEMDVRNKQTITNMCTILFDEFEPIKEELNEAAEYITDFLKEDKINQISNAYEKGGVKKSIMDKYIETEVIVKLIFEKDDDISHISFYYNGFVENYFKYQN